MGRNDSGLNVYREQDNKLDLDEGILRLKELKKRLSVEDVLYPNDTSIDCMIEILYIIENMDIPFRLSDDIEGIA